MLAPDLVFRQVKSPGLDDGFLDQLRGMFQITTFIETGTYLGDTAAAAGSLFAEVHTIELSSELARRAAQRFADQPHIHFHAGDSAKVLPTILRDIKGRCMFWLDGHYSEGITAQGSVNTPILAELDAIAQSGRKDTVILIDDIRLFVQRDAQADDPASLAGYPTLQAVRQAVLAIDTGYRFYVLGDIALAFPGEYPCVVSPLIRAMTLSRLQGEADPPRPALLQAESVIAQASGEEREALVRLHVANEAAEAYGLALHYRLWRALALIGEGRCLEAGQHLLRLRELGFSHWRPQRLPRRWRRAIRHLGRVPWLRAWMDQRLKALPALALVSVPPDALLELEPTAATRALPTLQLQPGVNPLEQLRAHGLLTPGAPLRLHLGCGEKHFDGYVNLDYPPASHNVMHIQADAVANIVQLNFPPDTVEEIRLHHVFEHFNRVTALAMLIKWQQWLKPGGQLRIETPDLLGSATTLVSPASYATKMAAVRHLAGDQAAAWAYHLDHWFPERYRRTLTALGFTVQHLDATTWPHEPYLANVEVVAAKTKTVAVEDQLTVADQLLWDSTVAPVEQPTHEVWTRQLRAVLGGALPPPPANINHRDFAFLGKAGVVGASATATLPLAELHDFNQRDRDQWVRAKAASVAAGLRVLDVGAGTCPYRDSFRHCDYRTHDFKRYTGPKLGDTRDYGQIDYESDVTQIPVPDGSFDVILCTEVLEHVPEPIEALREMARIVKPGGRLLLTAPLGSGLHQLPFHFYGGYTPEWYRHFAAKFGLEVVEISPNGGFFRLLAQECARVAWTLDSHRQLHGRHADQVRRLFGELLPRYLFALEERHFNDQFTVGYHVELKNRA